MKPVLLVWDCWSNPPLILKASGVNVIGIDISDPVRQAIENNAVDLGIVRSNSGIEEEISQFTSRYGVDSVIISAATSLDQ